MRTWITLLAVVLLLVGGCGPSAGEEATAGTATPTRTRSPKGPCGDGVCDEVEQANPGLCPEDCGTPDDTTATDTPTPRSVPRPTGEPTSTPTHEVGGGGGDGGDEPGPDESGDDDSQPPHDQPTETPWPTGRAKIELWWTSDYGCQADRNYAKMEVTLVITGDLQLTGSGQGTMSAEAMERCPDTEYGGVRTPESYPVTLNGTFSQEDGGWWVDLTAEDASEAFYTSGEVYHRECILCWLIPQFYRIPASSFGSEIGTLERFFLPEETVAGNVLTWGMNYEVGGAVHNGSAGVEILEDFK
jgi:hypothetical protein